MDEPGDGGDTGNPGDGSGGGSSGEPGALCVYEETTYFSCPGDVWSESVTRCAVVPDGVCPPPTPEGNIAGECLTSYTHLHGELHQGEDDCVALLERREQEQRSRQPEGFDEAECTDGVDQGENGLVDCGEPMCRLTRDDNVLESLACPRPDEATLVRCMNEVDDDSDGEVDCGVGIYDRPELFEDPEWVPPFTADAECATLCATVEGVNPLTCRNGIDDDGDGLVDCEERECREHRHVRVFNGEYYSCTEPEDTPQACVDSWDNDGDGLINCQDPDCGGCGDEGEGIETCMDGRDNDGDGLVDCEEPQCLQSANVLNCARPERGAACGDGYDNDRDGMRDDFDDDCAP